jgi:hypothetical protein
MEKCYFIVLSTLLFGKQASMQERNHGIVNVTKCVIGIFYFSTGKICPSSRNKFKRDPYTKRGVVFGNGDAHISEHNPRQNTWS